MSESWNEKWEIQHQLGEGGQGTVDLVVSAEYEWERQAAVQRIVKHIEMIAPHPRSQDDADALPAVAERLANAIERVTQPPLPRELGALKRLKMPTEQTERQQAMDRFVAELRALSELRDQTAVLKLLDSNQSAGWMVTEYHAGGTLHDHPEMFAGDALWALRAFEPIVAAVAAIHEKSIIHRDIKPANIFLSGKDELVLGDFGIVFWADEHQQRLTDTYGERVGSRGWMAPWADEGVRLKDINPTFDLFPLGKLLWAMVSGKRELRYWYWDDDKHNLERLFPDAPGMYWINARILALTVVEREKQCITSASELLHRVRDVITLLERRAQRLGVKWPCAICGLGHYGNFRSGHPQILGVVQKPDVVRLTGVQSVYGEEDSRMTVRAQVCDYCGHVQFFHYDPVPRAWET